MGSPSARLSVASLWRSGRDEAHSCRGEGSHSFWARLVVVDAPYRPIACDGLLVLVMDDRLLCRVLATAFTLVIYYRDIARMLCLRRRGTLELHVPSLVTPGTRVYMWEPTEATASENLYCILRSRVGRAARMASAMLPAEDAISVGTGWRSCAGQPSLFSPHALAATGFYEVPLGVGEGVPVGSGTMTSLASTGSSPPPCSTHGAGAASSACPGKSRVPGCEWCDAPVRLRSTRWSSVRIHDVQAPPEWRTDLLQPWAERKAPSSLVQGLPHCAECHAHLARLDALMQRALGCTGSE